jgi:hypothetical protein
MGCLPDLRNWTNIPHTIWSTSKWLKISLFWSQSNSVGSTSLIPKSGRQPIGFSCRFMNIVRILHITFSMLWPFSVLNQLKSWQHYCQRGGVSGSWPTQIRCVNLKLLFEGIPVRGHPSVSSTTLPLFICTPSHYLCTVSRDYTYSRRLLHRWPDDFLNVNPPEVNDFHPPSPLGPECHHTSCRHIGTGPRDTTAPSAITWTPIYRRLGDRRLGTVIPCISFVDWPSQGSLEHSLWISLG